MLFLESSSKIDNRISFCREQHAEEMAELSETVEMATLDKEMAEERAETLQLELDAAKEKLEELQLDMDIIKAEMGEEGSGDR